MKKGSKLSEEAKQKLSLAQRRIKPDLEREIVRLYTEEKLVETAIAKIIGCSVGSVTRYLKLNGIDTREQWLINTRKAQEKNRRYDSVRSTTIRSKTEKERLTKTKKDRAIQLFGTGQYSCTKVAEIVKADRHVVSRWLRAEGIDIRSQQLLWAHTKEANNKRAKSLSEFHKKCGFSEKTRKQIGDKNRLTLEKIKERHPWFYKIEEPKEDFDGNIVVKCKLCNKEFVPSRLQLKKRIAAIESEHTQGEHNMYCSENCKAQCSIYHVSPINELAKRKRDNRSHYYTKQKLHIWSSHVIARDKECLYCGSTEKLHAHHINPKSTHPKEALDPDNGITVCKDCHRKLHTGECSTAYLAAIAC